MFDLFACLKFLYIRVVQKLLIPKRPLMENVYEVPALMTFIIFRVTSLNIQAMFSVILTKILGLEVGTGLQVWL